MGILGLLLPLIPSLIQGVEKIFKKPAPAPGAPPPATGPDKLDAVTQMIRQLIAALTAAQVPLPDGKPIPPAPLTDDALHAAIETVLAQLKAAGTLDNAPAGIQSDIWIFRGTPVKLPAA